MNFHEVENKLSGHQKQFETCFPSHERTCTQRKARSFSSLLLSQNFKSNNTWTDLTLSNSSFPDVSAMSVHFLILGRDVFHVPPASTCPYRPHFHQAAVGLRRLAADLVESSGWIGNIRLRILNPQRLPF